MPKTRRTFKKDDFPLCQKKKIFLEKNKKDSRRPAYISWHHKERIEQVVAVAVQ
jgi:hypothetical protein